jgi:hypothetical protein
MVNSNNYALELGNEIWQDYEHRHTLGDNLLPHVCALHGGGASMFMIL